MIGKSNTAKYTGSEVEYAINYERLPINYVGNITNIVKNENAVIIVPSNTTVIYVSNDNGNTFEEVVFSEKIADVIFSEAHEIYIALSASGYLYTSNDGKTFEKHPYLNDGIDADSHASILENGEYFIIGIKGGSSLYGKKLNYIDGTFSYDDDYSYYSTGSANFNYPAVIKSKDVIIFNVKTLSNYDYYYALDKNLNMYKVEGLPYFNGSNFIFEISSVSNDENYLSYKQSYDGKTLLNVASFKEGEQEERKIFEYKEMYYGFGLNGIKIGKTVSKMFTSETEYYFPTFEMQYGAVFEDGTAFVAGSGSVYKMFFDQKYTIPTLNLTLEAAKECYKKTIAESENAKSYAVGGTGTREGEDTDNAKYYCEVAKKAAGIAPGQEPSETYEQVQADWDETDTESPAFIKNKPETFDIKQATSEVAGKAKLYNELNENTDGSITPAAVKTALEQLEVSIPDNVQADFLTTDGFGNLRYYNGHFQYYDADTSTWIDTSVTPSNVYIMNMIPQEMKSILGVYDTDLGKYKLKFEEPDDTIIDGQVACVVEKVIIRRKLGSVPESETDGDLVLEIKRRDFGAYKNEYYVDTALSPFAEDVWYYKAFPMSTTGFYNTNSSNETDGIVCKDYSIFGFKLDQNESDPASMITYLSDCDNKYYRSAKMNYTSDTFDYGDWDDAWFIKNLKPCMLKYDGTVDYELDKNDYTKKLDGTDSDVANDSYGGNAMIGVPKVYCKIVYNGDDTANIYFCDKKLDDDFKCWSHIDNNGNEIDYCYMPIYNGSNVNSVLRSISGKAPTASQTAASEITYAKANNTGSDIIWYTELFNDRMLINLLLLLIGKSTNTQVIFGTGNNNSYVSNSNTGIKNTGAMNTKGLFWGNQDNKSGVKVFGMENWYGNIWRRIGGWINDKGTQKIKMTYGQSDNSTVDGYNLDGNGYITIGNSTPSGTSGGYISKMMITDNGLIPTIASGSATTYYCDGLWFNNSQVDYAFVGGGSDGTSRVGALSSALDAASSDAYWNVGAALSCKPLA